MKLKISYNIAFPCFFSLLWALYYLSRVFLGISPVIYGLGDMFCFFQSGQNLSKNLYQNVGCFYYLPIAALYYYISMPTFFLGYWVLLFTNIVLSFILISLIDKLAKLKGIENLKYRFLINTISTNGWNLLYTSYYQGQSKILTATLFLLFLIREFTTEKKNLRFYVIQYNILWFLIAFTPNYVLFFLVYLLHDTKLRAVLNKENFKKILIIIVSFIVQNFLFIIYPNLLFDFLTKGVLQFGQARQTHLEFSSGNIFENFLVIQTLSGVVFVPQYLVFYCATLATIIAVLVITFLKTDLFKKSVFFSISMVFFYMFTTQFLILTSLLIIQLFLFLEEEKEDFMEFFKKNITTISAIFVLFISNIIMSNNSTIIKYFPFITSFNILIVILIYCRNFIMFLFILIILFYNYYKLNKRDGQDK